MKTITVKQIILDINLFKQKLFYGVFALCGGGTVLLPFMMRNKLSNENFFIGIIFMTVVFAIPIGYFAGLRKIIQAIKLEKLVRNKNIVIEKDVVTSKRLTAHNQFDDIDSYCQISYKNYTKRTSKYCVVTRAEYEKVKKGDVYFMVYENKKDDLICCYPAKEYKIDDDLLSTVITEK